MLPSTQSIRLIALPLSKRSNSLIYFYAQQLPSLDQQSDHKSPSKTSQSSPISPSALIRKLTDTGTKQWNKLADSAHGSWKSKIYNTGERMMDKIPFEEWALKSIDPPPIPSKIPSPETGSKGEDEPSQVIELLYPGSLCVERELMSGLQRTMAESEPYHRKWMKLNIVLSPLTLPCAIVPLIPNLPFFYMMWRSWSHWRAYKASRYLHQMIGSGHVRPVSSAILDSLYAHTQTRGKANNRGRKHEEKDNTPEEGKAESEIILSQEMVFKLQKQLDLPPESTTEIFRGIHQAQQRLENLSTNSTPNPSSNPNQPSP
ncbi:hypothetical protein PtA15_9A88 [Puccinia triticina]|uniref:Mitochondrial K+-H+ exchange-related-domain-containing protein n=1 Tax=Puccinia triticina TaxID=208348 RepID=A0ABY7CRW8_9BASI|nr:uncharacterized protein PtA15_9A88 [Puccinia triticina]WAQ87964.1 hypothetical protein PtA15_9A88 [Puccinia triticina]WAR60154.1 hypothetical protein PtB15_9B91 [Puccinia triticina]